MNFYGSYVVKEGQITILGEKIRITRPRTGDYVEIDVNRDVANAHWGDNDRLIVKLKNGEVRAYSNTSSYSRI